MLMYCLLQVENFSCLAISVSEENLVMRSDTHLGTAFYLKIFRSELNLRNSLPQPFLIKSFFAQFQGVKFCLN